MRKGFAADTDVAWDPDVLEALEQTLALAAPGSEFEWSNEHVVNVVLPDQSNLGRAFKRKSPMGCG